MPTAGIVSHAAENSRLAILLLHICITQKTQLGQQFWDNKIYSSFWIRNRIFWHTKSLQNEKKKSVFCSDTFAFFSGSRGSGNRFVRISQSAWIIRIWPQRSQLWHEHFLITGDTITTLLWVLSTATDLSNTVQWDNGCPNGSILCTPKTQMGRSDGSSHGLASPLVLPCCKVSKQTVGVSAN